ncbi:MAG: rRNA maturation RNase YbeY [Bacteroidota bacterium]
MSETILFHTEEINFSLADAEKIKQWLLTLVAQHEQSVHELNYIFCSDEYLLGLNKQYLAHDYYTDILTFPYEHPEETGLWSDIYISIDRVRENAQSFQSNFEDELHRVMAHGVLHLLGFDDHGEAEPEMRQQEKNALALRQF